ncbi:MAG: hypothetical protein J5379_00005, partial [Clostridiales bacterium]|nr:hypothetical protein [Clostridiales bacterium]
SFVDKYVQVGETYRYEIRSGKEFGIGDLAYSSPASEQVEVTRTMEYPVLYASATPKSGVTMTISWQSYEGAASYEIWYRLDGEDFTILKTAGRTQTSTSHTGLTAGTRYSYKVVAKDSSGNILAVSEIKKNVPLATPQFTSAESTDEGIVLTWTKVSGGDRYIIYRYNQYDEVEFYSAAITETSFVDKNVQTGEPYRYEIVSSKSFGVGEIGYISKASESVEVIG